MANPESSTQRRAVVISPNAPLVDELEPLLKAHLADSAVSRLQAYPAPPDLAAVIGGGVSNLVFLDTVSDPDKGLELLEALSRFGSHVQVVILLEGDAPDFILRCLRAGAADFLVQPFTAEQIAGTFSKLARSQAAPDNQPREVAKIIAVIPAKGACGASTIAANLAFQWKRSSGRRILLVDLDPLTGTISFMLKIKSIYSFLDALQRSQELDDDLWNTMVTEVHGVDVLLAPELMLESIQDLQNPAPVLEYARNRYDVVIVDAASVYTEWNLNLARMANEVLLVTTNELPSLQAAQRALSYLDTNRIGRWKVHLVVNRYSRDVGLNRDVIGTALHTEVYETVPSDYDSVQKALLNGKPILTGTSFGKSIQQLTQRLGGTAEPAKKSSSFGGLLGLFSTKTSK